MCETTLASRLKTNVSPISATKSVISHRMMVSRIIWVLFLLLWDSAKAQNMLDLGMFANPPLDPCVDNNTLATKCVPDFQNIAFGKEVIASSTCGNPPSRHCKPRQSENELQNCFICDSRRQYPPTYLTDLNNQYNETCWVSEASKDHPSNVSLTLSLGKKFQVTYVSLQFCSRIPESMVIYKSKDFGKTWIPFQYYTSDCLAKFNVDPTAVVTKYNEHEALCSQNYSKGGHKYGTRVAFSTLKDRPSSYHFEESHVLQDWVTTTDIKIVFLKMGSPPKGLGHLSTTETAEDESFYGVSDFAIGGRCKCNGHASKCIPNSEGKLMCECKHNAEGADCEKCKPFHLDRPWGRATDTDAHECVACNCNLHAKHCRFNMELYELSGYVSGGVCRKCRHNTEGRFCNHCREGFYRDPRRDITHRKACRACNCHMIGALGKTCNATTGQCQCKDGVIGLTCNMCAPGYQQSRSPIAPCIAIKTPGKPRPPPPSQNQNTDGKCKSKCNKSRRLKFSKFCRRDYAIKAEIVAKQDVGEFVKFTINVLTSYKKITDRKMNKRGETLLWVPKQDLRCRCPRMKLRETYMIVGKVKPNETRPGFIADRRSIVRTWRNKWQKRLRQYQKQEMKGSCYQKYTD